MNTSPFEIQYHHRNGLTTAVIHPCCKEDSVVDYEVWIDDKLVFMATKDVEDKARWVVGLKNADDDISEEVIQSIGNAIDEQLSKQRP